MKDTAIIFDVDDTLYKERDYRLSGFRTIARHFAASCGLTPGQLYELMKDEPDRAFENVRDLAAVRGVDIPVDLQLAIYRTHRPDIALDRDTASTLTYLRDNGYQLGVITDGRAFGQLNKLAALELRRFMAGDLMMATVLHGTDKNSPDPFVMMQGKFKPGTHFVYVGDNPQKDFHHPNLLGWTTIMLNDTDSVNVHHQRLAEFPADYRPQTTIDKLTELKQLF